MRLTQVLKSVQRAVRCAPASSLNMILRDGLNGRIENPTILSRGIFPCQLSRVPTSPVKIPPPRFLSNHAAVAAKLKLAAFPGAHRKKYHHHMHASSPELQYHMPLSVTRDRREPNRAPPLEKASRPGTVASSAPNARLGFSLPARGARGGNATAALRAPTLQAARASRTSSMASSTTAANVQAVLARLDRFLREQNMRPLDLFRSSSINTSYAGTAEEREKSSAMRGLSGDVMGDDLLSVSELGALLKKIGLGLSEAEVQDVVAFFDTNGDGEVDVEEFSTELRAARRVTAMAARADHAASVAQAVLRGDDPPALWNLAPASAAATACRAQSWGQRKRGDERPVWGSGRQQRYLPSIADRLPAEALLALQHLQEYLTAHRMRPVDLFRSKKLQAHSGEAAGEHHAAAKLAAKRNAARGSWQKVPDDHAAESMSAAQLRRLLTSRDLHMAPEEVDAVVTALDRDGNGEIDAKELTLALRAARRQE